LTSLPPDLTRIGHLLAPHGVKGAVKLFVIGEPGQLRRLKRVYVEGLGWRRLERVQESGPGLVLELTGVTDRSQAEALRGRGVYAADAELPPLPEGEFYYHELRGRPLLSASGERLGEVVDVLDMGQQDLLLVRHPLGESAIPLQAPYLVVTRRGRLLDLSLHDPPAGLLDGDAELVPPHAEERGTGERDAGDGDRDD